MGATLTLGWQMTDDNMPRSWLDGVNPLDRAEPLETYVVDADSLRNHSLLFAQSGSGKSFFVGRLIEEMALHTKARIVVLDPDSDYSLFHEPNLGIYDNPRYNALERSGVLPTERDAVKFTEPWKTVPIHHLSANLQIPVTKLVPHVFLGDLDQQANFAYASALMMAGRVASYLESNWESSKIELGVTCNSPTLDHVLRALDICVTASDRVVDVKRLGIKLGNHADNLAKEIARPGADPIALSKAHLELSASNSALEQELDNLARLTTEQALGFVKMQLRIAGTRLAVAHPSQNIFTRPDVYIVDTPTFSTTTMRASMLQHVVDELWDLHELEIRSGKLSTPTFLFIDEAHQIIPSDVFARPAASTTRESLRRIAAEGRKYGIYLFLISQRPDKLDPWVASECRNKIIMRVGNLRVFREAALAIGLTDAQTDELAEVVRFGTGRAFVLGPIAAAGNPQPDRTTGAAKFYVAARRTREGSAKLGAEWLGERI